LPASGFLLLGVLSMLALVAHKRHNK
jgi:hypothetical protein